MIEAIRRRWTSNHTEFVIQTGFYLGLLSLGVAVGAGYGLKVLQVSCMEAGFLPAVGANIADGGILNALPCYHGALELKRGAEIAALVGAVFLGAGFVAQYISED